MFVRPKDGLKVRRMDTKTLLPECGEDVPDVAWCRRRHREGSVDLEQLAPPAGTTPDAGPPSA